MFLVYNLLLSMMVLTALPWLPLGLALCPRFRPGVGERFGWYSKSKLRVLAGARPVWIHAASVGEVSAAGMLIAALKAESPDQKILLSTFTDTGNEMATRAGGADVVIFLPLDYPLIVRRALTRFNPAALVVIETEYWPNLFREAFLRGIPTLLLSGRLSERALKRYLLYRTFFCRVMRFLAALGMQSDEDARRVIRLGADSKRVTVTGNLKRSVGLGTMHCESEVKSLKARAVIPAKRPLLVVGSSHRGEEEILLNVFEKLKEQFTDLQLAVAPRHPERFSEVELLLQRYGLSFEKKSRIDGQLNFEQDVMLIDTLGDLGSFYARADIAFVGGSLVERGGHNLLEPAFFKKPVIFGPFMANFKTIAEEMKQSGGGIEVRDTDELLGALSDLLGDVERRRSVGEKAFKVATGDDGVAERSLKLLRRYVDVSGGLEARDRSGGIMAAYE